MPRSLWVHESANGYFRRVGHAARKLAPDALARFDRQVLDALHFVERNMTTAARKPLGSIRSKLWSES